MDEHESLVSHEDIFNLVRQNEIRTERWFISAATGFALVLFPSAVWIWSAHSAQAGFNADINARVTENRQAYQTARETQQRIEARLDEIHRFLREDAKEVREELRALREVESAEHGKN